MHANEKNSTDIQAKKLVLPYRQLSQNSLPLTKYAIDAYVEQLLTLKERQARDKATD